MPSKPAPIAGLRGLRAKARTLLMTASGDAVTKKPAALAYGHEEVPPAAVTWISAVQHVGVCAIFSIYPLIIARQARLPVDQITNILQLGFLVLAVATFLQALPRGPVGSRFLAPSIYTGVYLAPSILAMKTGGLPLVWGMTIFAGLVEMVLSRAWSRLRPFIPPESAGLVVFLVGTIIGLAAFRVVLEDSPTGTLTAQDGIVTGCALAVMIALNIWNKGLLRLFCILVGMLVGYIAAAMAGLLTLHDLSNALNRPLLALPTVSRISWAFDWSLAVPFAVSGLAAAMNTTAVLTTYQRLTDADWVRPHMTSIGRGVLGDAIATTIAGLCGTYGVTVSSANVGLVAATGVASRVIAFAVAAILAFAALQPTVIGVLTIMPRPVMAAAMLFTAVFIMISGVVALSLNLLFRIGIRRTVTVTIDPGTPDADEITKFIERNAGIWGARRDVINRVEFAVQQMIDAVIAFCDARGPIRIDISYDEFVINVVVTYDGAPLEFPTQPPTHVEIIEAEDGHQRLAGFLIRRSADRMGAVGDSGQTVVRLHFDH
jgi:NCS2 family nucleobase:cation symporter-2